MEALVVAWVRLVLSDRTEVAGQTVGGGVASGAGGADALVGQVIGVGITRALYNEYVA